MDASTTKTVTELLEQGKSRDEIHAELLGKGMAGNSIDDVLDILLPAAGSESAPAALSPSVAAAEPAAPAPQPGSVIGVSPVSPAAAAPAPVSSVPESFTAMPEVMPRTGHKLLAVLVGVIIVAILAAGGAYAYTKRHQTASQATSQSSASAAHRSPLAAPATGSSSDATSGSSTGSSSSSSVDPSSGSSASSDGSNPNEEGTQLPPDPATDSNYDTTPTASN